MCISLLLPFFRPAVLSCRSYADVDARKTSLFFFSQSEKEEFGGREREMRREELLRKRLATAKKKNRQTAWISCFLFAFWKNWSRHRHLLTYRGARRYVGKAQLTKATREKRGEKKKRIAIELCSKDTRQRPRCSAAHFRGGSVYPCLFNLQARPSCTVKLTKKESSQLFLKIISRANKKK